VHSAVSISSHVFSVHAGHHEREMQRPCWVVENQLRALDVLRVPLLPPLPGPGPTARPVTFFQFQSHQDQSLPFIPRSHGNMKYHCCQLMSGLPGRSPGQWRESCNSTMATYKRSPPQPAGIRRSGPPSCCSPFGGTLGGYVYLIHFQYL
jgi:hypothetical protein